MTYVVCMSSDDLLICRILNFEVLILRNVCFLFTAK
jgi:hypothetical protein